MFEESAFRGTRGTRSVDDIGELVRREGRVWAGSRQEVKEVLIAVKAQERAVEIREASSDVRKSDEERRLSILKDESQAILREGRIEREISTASLEDSEEGSDHIGGTGQADSSERLGRERVSEEEMSDAVGEQIKLEVREGTIVEEESGSLGVQINLLFEEVLDAGVVRIGGVGLIPVGEEGKAFSVREDGQRREREGEAGGHSLEEGSEVREQAEDGGAGETGEIERSLEEEFIAGAGDEGQGEIGLFDTEELLDMEGGGREQLIDIEREVFEDEERVEEGKGTGDI